MKFSQIIILVILLIVVAAYVIGDSVRMSERIEKYANEKLEDPKKEAVEFWNIKYVYFLGQHQRALDLIDKYNQRYHNTELDRGEKIQYMKAKTYDNLMMTPAAKEEYKIFLEEFPEAKKAEDVKNRLRELNNFY